MSNEQNKHTPGPWTEERHGEICGKTKRIATIQPLGRKEQRCVEDKANARLISKAWLLPEVVEILHNLLSKGTWQNNPFSPVNMVVDFEMYKKARALLAKLEEESYEK